MSGGPLPGGCWREREALVALTQHGLSTSVMCKCWVGNGTRVRLAEENETLGTLADTIQSHHTDSHQGDALITNDAKLSPREQNQTGTKGF